MHKVGLRDLVWTYSSQILNFGSGLITLPIVLSTLSTEEIAIHYLLLSLSSFVLLLELGFSTQISRSLTYILNGSSDIIEEGLVVSNNQNVVNYRKVKTIILTAKKFYLTISLISLLILISAGTFYFYNLTEGFSNIDFPILIWVLTVLSVFFNLYYTYYNALLIGRGLVKDASKAVLFSKLTNVVLVVILLWANFALLGVVIANIVSPFIGRFYSHRYLFNREFVKQIRTFHISKQEVNNVFKKMWFNGRKLGVIALSTFVATKINLFISGLYLESFTIASFGLLMQFSAILSAISSNVFYLYQPNFAALQAIKDRENLAKAVSLSMICFYLLFSIGSIVIVELAPLLLEIIESNVGMPSKSIVIIFLLITFLEANHSHFGSIILARNSVPFVWPGLISALLNLSGVLIVLHYTNYGLLGIVIVQGASQLIYNNWKWPYVILKELKLSYFEFISLGVFECVRVASNKSNRL